MKTQADCWSSILDGKTLISGGTRVNLVSGEAKDNKGFTYSFIQPKNWEICEEPTYYYKWEKLDNGRIHTLEHISDEEAKKYGYTNRGYRKIEETKRTWED